MHDPAVDRIEEWRLAGVYDPGASDAAARLELLEHLVDRGLSTEQIASAFRAGNLVTAASDLALFDLGSLFTLDQVADASHVSADRVRRIRLATGFPVEAGSLLPAWAAEDVAGFELGSALFGEAPVLAFSRVLGASAARIAEAAVALFLTEVQEDLAEAGATPVEWAEANEQAVALVGVIETIVGHLLREHLRRAVLEQRADAGQWSGPDVRLAVGFVDLADSTAWASPLSVRQQADALAIFEASAWDIASSRGGRVLKLIGDEAMFVSAEPDTACRIALELCSVIDAEPSLPDARGAVGYGLVAPRDGDYYGSLVNLVSRAVKAADYATVVTTEETRERLAETGSTLRLRALEPTRLRGIGAPVRLYSVSAG